MTVEKFEADPHLRPSLTAAGFARLLSLEGFHFEPRAGAAAGDLQLTIPIEALHRAPYVWLARGLITLYTATFLLVTRALWRRRRSEAA